MQMMIDSGKVYSKKDLVLDIIRKFGPQARFFTCSAQNMTADQLVTFLDSRGKFLAQDGGIKTSPDLMCNH